MSFEYMQRKGRRLLAKLDEALIQTALGAAEEHVDGEDYCSDERLEVLVSEADFSAVVERAGEDIDRAQAEERDVKADLSSESGKSDVAVSNNRTVGEKISRYRGAIEAIATRKAALEDQLPDQREAVLPEGLASQEDHWVAEDQAILNIQQAATSDETCSAGVDSKAAQRQTSLDKCVAPDDAPESSLESVPVAEIVEEEKALAEQTASFSIPQGSMLGEKIARSRKIFTGKVQGMAALVVRNEVTSLANGRKHYQLCNSTGCSLYKRDFGMPEARAQYKFTDPKSQIIKASKRGFRRSYTMQEAVSGWDPTCVWPWLGRKFNCCVLTGTRRIENANGFQKSCMAGSSICLDSDNHTFVG